MARPPAAQAGKDTAAPTEAANPVQAQGRADKLRLGPARGIMLGLVLGVAAWLLIGMVFFALR